MSTLKIIEQSSQRFVVEGNLTFSSINKKTVESFRFTTNADNIEIDLKRVNIADSAGLALLIEWIRMAKRKNIRLQFENIPDQLMTLAKLTGLEHVVHMTEQNGTIAIATQKFT